MYPSAGDWINQQAADQAIVDFARQTHPKDSSSAGADATQAGRTTTSPPAADIARLYRDMAAYNQQLFDTHQAALDSAAAYERPSFDLTEYGLPDAGMVGYLDVPRMDMHVPVYLGASKANMARGAAQMTGTSLPVGGQNTNCVIAGHRGMAARRMFRDIDKLQVGDAVDVTNFRETLHYRVAQIKIIQPDDIQEILIQPGRDLVTLLSCHPYPTNRQRYLVYCERV